MLKIFFLTALFISSAFAIEVNEISGTFSSAKNAEMEQIQKQEEDTQEDIYSANTFRPESDVSRSPASIVEENQKDFSVNEITGTFQ